MCVFANRNKKGKVKVWGTCQEERERGIWNKRKRENEREGGWSVKTTIEKNETEEIEYEEGLDLLLLGIRASE